MLSDLKQKYQQGQLSKAEFIDQAFVQHQYLFDYPALLRRTNIKEILLTEEGVQFKDSKGIMFLVKHADKRIAPIEILNFDAYEVFEAGVFLKIIDSKDVVFDIGANIGWYSMAVARSFPETRVYAFEPVKEIHTDLSRNIALNHFANITIEDFGFSNEEAVLDFYYDKEYSTKTSLSNLTKDAVKKIECRVMRLDDYIEQHKVDSLDVIKCDVEGAELLVYQGGIKSLTKYKPIIFSEMLRKWSKKFDYHPNDILHLLAGIGYKCFALEEGAVVPIKKVTDETIATNFLFLHPEKHQEKINLLVKEY